MKSDDHEPDQAYLALTREARAAVRAHDLVRAERLAREALSQAPAKAAAYNLLAAIRSLQHRHPEAMDLLRAGLAVEPTYGPAQKNLDGQGSQDRRGWLLLGDEGDEGGRQ